MNQHQSLMVYNTFISITYDQSPKTCHLRHSFCVIIECIKDFKIHLYRKREVSMVKLTSHQSHSAGCMKRKFMIVLAAAALSGISCLTNLPVSNPETTDNSQATGSLRLSLSNGDEAVANLAKMVFAGQTQQTDSVEHIWITIKEVQLHIASDPSENGWRTVATPNKKFDFLSLVNGLTAPLDLYALPAGHYTQIRLMLGDDVEDCEDCYDGTIPANTIVINGETYPITIPSAWRTGIKCVRSIFIKEGEKTEICLAFDVFSAIHYSAAIGYMMKPAYRTFKCDGSEPPDYSDEE